MKASPVNMETRKNLDMRTGDTVRVHQKIQDKGGKTRIQVFEGMILARKHGNEDGATFTVRRVSGGFGVEKIFPLYSPMIDKIEVTKRSKVRRSKLYHIRKTALKQVSKRLRMMFVDFKTSDEVEEPEQSEQNNSENDQDTNEFTEEKAEEVIEKKEEAEKEEVEAEKVEA